MNITKNIWKKLNSWAILLALFASGAAFASTAKTSAPSQQLVQWGRLENGGWKEVEQGDLCISTPGDYCKENFPLGQDPNEDDSNGIPVDAVTGYLQPAN